MKDILGPVRRSIVGILPKQLSSSLKSIADVESSPIRWTKGNIIGSGAYGQVFVGMNLDSGELLAVKQVSIPTNCASKEKTQAHIRELEEEVNLLKNLSHPNIVRYLGTATEAGLLNILLEYVPGGSISSMLEKFGPFGETVIRLYTKQLLLGLEYLHNNEIMHRDIKGANILVNADGCIKLADFGASKKVVELATMSNAISLKGTPNWMAPEVICQTGHSFSADIWSVGCTVIEMATGKPPYSQEYNQVGVLFHIGSTKSPPTLPEHLSVEAKDFLLRCLEKEPKLRFSATELLQHPFITGKFLEHPSVSGVPHMGNSGYVPPPNSTNPMNIMGADCASSNTSPRIKSFWRGNGNDDDMCEIFDKDDFVNDAPININSSLSSDCSEGFISLSGPVETRFDKKVLAESSGRDSSLSQTIGDAAADEDVVTEPKLLAFLAEKALELKKLQTPLFEEYMNPIKPFLSNSKVKSTISKSPSKIGSPKRTPSGKLSTAKIVSPGKHIDQMCGVSISGNVKLNQSDHHLGELNESVNDPLQEPIILSPRKKEKYREELFQEIDMERALRLAGGGKMGSPKR